MLAPALDEAGLPLPLTDVEIAVASATAGAPLWTRDDDFKQLHSHLPTLQLYDLT